MGDGLFYLNGSILLLACVLKVPALIRTWHDMLLRSICALLLFGSGVLFITAPGSLAGINSVTGVFNFAAPLAYSWLTMFSGASVVLIINWRDDSGDRARRWTRWCIAVYTILTVGIFSLFWIGSAPVEQLTAFDTYYANTPYIREMIVLYLLAHTVSSVMASALCLRWSNEVSIGALKAGLRVLVFGYSMHICYDIAKSCAVAARWSGANWDFLSTSVAPVIATPSALVVGVGFMLPFLSRRVGDAFADMRQYRRLAPLARELDGFTSSGNLRVPIAWSYPSLSIRLTQRETRISDGLIELSSFFDEKVRQDTCAEAEALKQRSAHPDQPDGQGEVSPDVLAEAAMIGVAIDRRSAVNAAGSEDRVVARRTDLTSIARALRSSSLVAEVRRRHRVTADGSLHG